MPIRMTKFKAKKTIFSQVDNEDIIKSCFNPCEDKIRIRVSKWLEHGRLPLLVRFKDFMVRLEKL